MIRDLGDEKSNELTFDTCHAYLPHMICDANETRSCAGISAYEGTNPVGARPSFNKSREVGQVSSARGHCRKRRLLHEKINIFVADLRIVSAERSGASTPKAKPKITLVARVLRHRIPAIVPEIESSLVSWPSTTISPEVGTAHTRRGRAAR